MTTSTNSGSDRHVIFTDHLRHPKHPCGIVEGPINIRPSNLCTASGWLQLLSLTLLVLVVGVVTAVAAPVITTVTPNAGAVGTAVTINGSGFSLTPGSNVVYFGAVKAVVTASTTGSITTSVPLGATYAPVTVTVSNLTAYSGAPFLVTFTGCVVPNAITAGSLTTRYNFTADTVGNRGVILADLDLDGKPDAIVTEVWRNNIAVFHNTNANPTPLTLGTFGARVNFATDPGSGAFGGGEPYHIAAGDLDGDGKLDLAVVNFAANTISIFRNTSVLGTISFAARIDLPTGGVNPDCIRIGDINGDGKPDLVVGYFGSAFISVFTNTSTGTSITFAAPANFTSLTQTMDLALGDMDNDGKLDVEVVSSYPSVSTEVQNFRNTSTGGAVSFYANYYTIPLAMPFAIALGDLNGDGKLDVVTTNRNSAGTYHTINVDQNASIPGQILFIGTQVITNLAADPGDVAIADMNGDGKPDIVFNQLVNLTNDAIGLMENTSTTSPMTFNPPVLFTADHSPFGVAVGDVDGDGRPDVLDSHPNYNVMSVWHNLCTPVVVIDTPNCTPAPSHLVAWWPFDEATHPAGSTCVDLTSQATAYAPTNVNNVATIVGTIGTAGYVNNGLLFNGVAGNYLTAQNDPSLDFGTSSFSIDAWIKLADTAAVRKTIVSKRVVGAIYSTGYTLYIDEQHNLNLQLGIGSGNPGYAFGPVPIDAWTFVAAVIDRTPSSGAPDGKVTLYVNNTSRTFLLSAGFASNNISNTNPVWIGQLAPSGYPDDPFDGGIDELEIFNTSVDSGVLNQIYRARQAGKCRVLATNGGATSPSGCCDTASFGVASSTILHCIGCYPGNRDWRSINVVNRQGTPINSITLQYFDCNGSPVTTPALAQLTYQNLHVIRDVPYHNSLMPISRFVGPGYIADLSTIPAPANENVVSFDLGLPCNAVPNCWSIRLLIEHKNPSAPTGLDTCYVTLPNWRPCPHIFPSPTWSNISKLDSPIYVASFSLNEGVAGGVGYVSFTTADSTDTIIGGTGGTWASAVDPNDPDTSNPRLASFLQSKGGVEYELVPDSTGTHPAQFLLFIGVGKNGQDRKYRPTVIRGIYDPLGGLLGVDTITATMPTSSVMPVGAAQPESGAIEITDVTPNPAHTSIEVKYTLGANEQAKLELFNALGLQEGVLADGYQTRGEHTAHFVVSQLPAGSYYLRLSTYNGQTSATVKVVH